MVTVNDNESPACRAHAESAKRGTGWQRPTTVRGRLVDFATLLMCIALSIGVMALIPEEDGSARIFWAIIVLFHLIMYRRLLTVAWWAWDTCIQLENSVPVDLESGQVRPTDPPFAPGFPYIYVLVAAYKAAGSISSVIKALSEQVYPADRFGVVIVTEATERLEAADAGSLHEARPELTTPDVVDETLRALGLGNFVHLCPLKRGYKAGGLNYAYNYLQDARLLDDPCNTYFLVMDADSLLDRNALRLIAHEIQRDPEANVIRQLVSIPLANFRGGNPFVQFVAAADCVGAIGNWARNVRGCRRPSLHAGSGMLIPVSLANYLARKNGQPWNPTTITEDADLIFGEYSLLDGMRKRPRAVPSFLVEAVPEGAGWRTLYRRFWMQRVRWATGGPDELGHLLKNREREMFVQSTPAADAFKAYTPAATERIAATGRRLWLALNWLGDQLWWGWATWFALFSWPVGSLFFRLPGIVSVFALISLLLMPIVLGVGVRRYLRFVQIPVRLRELFVLYWFAFIGTCLYTLPVTYTHLLCALGQRYRLRGWNPTTVKPQYRDL